MKYVVRRDVQSSRGDFFSCFYTINYNAKGVVSTKKTSVLCDPDTEGGNTVQVFDLPKVGPISIKHSIKAGKDVVKKAEPFTGASSTVQPMNCSCKASFPHELMAALEAMKPEEMTAAGRSQPGTQRTFLLSIFLNNIRTQIQALISSLTGGLIAGRKVELAALREIVVTRGGNSLLAQLRAQILAAIQTAIQNFLASLGIGRSLVVPSLDRQLAFQTIFQNCIAQIQAAIQNFLNAFGLGRTGLSSSFFSSQILAAIQTAITNFLNSLGINLGRKINLAETERQLLTSTEMDLILAEMGFSGGIEELTQIIQSEMAALFAQMEEMEQLSDEEVFQHVMEMVGSSGNGEIISY